MSERPISNMPTLEFDAIIDAFIARETRDTGEIKAPLFYAALREMGTRAVAVIHSPERNTISCAQLLPTTFPWRFGFRIIVRATSCLMPTIGTAILTVNAGMAAQRQNEQLKALPVLMSEAEEVDKLTDDETSMSQTIRTEFRDCAYLRL